MVEWVQETCVKCHGGESTKAGVDFTEFRDELDVWSARTIWSRASELVAEGEMPPDTEPPVADEKRAAFSGWVQHTLDHVDVSRIPSDPGFVPPRRLTAKEYQFTIQDLFGLRPDQVYAFPNDLVIGDSFDNDASTLSVESLWFEKALEAADATVRAVWSDEAALDRLLVVRPSPPPVEDEALYVTSAAVSEACDTGGSFFSVVAQVTGNPERIFVRAPIGEDDVRGGKELAFDGETLVYRIGGRDVLRAGDLEFEEGESHWVGLTVRDGYASLYLNGRFLVGRSDFHRPDPAGYRLKVGFRDEEDDDDEDEEGGREAEPRDPAMKKFLFFADGLSDEAMRGLSREASSAVLPRPTFRWDSGMATPPPEDFVTVEDAAEMVVRNLLREVFRREPSEEEQWRYIGLLQEGLDAGLTFEIALQVPVATALVSPSFLFRSETAAATDASYPVSGVDLANRLSYFLWSSMPDRELRAVARAGKLSDPKELLVQVDRMLSDEKAVRFYERFMLQWLRTEGLGDTIRPDPVRFPDISADRLASMRAEGVVLFQNAVEKNRSLIDLLTGHYTFMDGELAKHYGFPGVTGPEWREVRLADDTRGGLLTQAAVLTVSSSPKRTSPVFRGKWLLEVLLGEPPPPPPANVPELPEEVKGGGSTLRELLERHRSQEACAGCHSRIDPYGLALEQYDPVGRLRPDRRDTVTTLYTGESIDGAGALKEYLARERKSDFVRHLVRRMLTYALGRELTFPDERPVQAIVDQLENDGYGARTLIHELVLSEPFRYRKNPTP